MVAEARAGEATGAPEYEGGRLGPATLEAGEGWLKPDGQPHALNCPRAVGLLTAKWSLGVAAGLGEGCCEG